MISAINSEKDYKVVLSEIEQLIDLPARAGTPEGDRLNVLTLLAQDYEQKQAEVAVPDPIEAIKFRMEQMNLTPRDLVPLIGSRSKVSEVLARKRPLTLSMIRSLHKGLGVPAKALLREQLFSDNRDEEVEWERFPIREMVARGWIKAKVHDVRRQARDLMKQFLAPLGADWAPVALYKQSQYVRSARQMDPYALAAWKARVCLRALESSRSRVQTRCHHTRLHARIGPLEHPERWTSTCEGIPPEGWYLLRSRGTLARDVSGWCGNPYQRRIAGSCAHNSARPNR